MNGFPQAYYTSGHTMPTPFTTTLYMNRFINTKKLVEIKYTNMPQNTTMKQFEKRFRLPDKSGIFIKGEVREMQKRDITDVLKLYNLQQQQYKVWYKLNQNDISHFLLPKKDVVWTYVIEKIENGKK